MPWVPETTYLFEGVTHKESNRRDLSRLSDAVRSGECLFFEGRIPGTVSRMRGLGHRQAVIVLPVRLHKVRS